MISIKNKQQLDLMVEAGKITAEALFAAEAAVKPGISTKYLDGVIKTAIEKHGARPTFLGYNGFPGSACISVNDEVIHGIPSEKTILKEGDIVKVDVGACYKGYNGDAARTFAVGKISSEAEALIAATRESFYRGVAQFRSDMRLGDIGHAIEAYVKSCGYSVVRQYVGHGIGKELHEDPSVPNYGTQGRGVRLIPGMTLAIEPMVNMGRPEVRTLSNHWTVVTVDGSLSAHYENTVALTADGPVLLTNIE